MVGNLTPGAPAFRTQLEALARNRRFRGIRIGSEPLRAAQSPGAVREDLKFLARRGLSVDVLIPPEQLLDAANLGRTISDLQIIVDHCSNVPVGSPAPNDWTAGLVACHYAPNVSMKVSGLVEGTGRRGGSAPTDASVYQTVLDAIWHPFGEDRVLFGSNWPVSLHFASYGTVLHIVQDYFATKGPGASAKYFHRNARRVYRLS
ncbi:MAG: amidohydrolase family protein [Verrucomicrobiota bacterium]